MAKGTALSIAENRTSLVRSLHESLGIWACWSSDLCCHPILRSPARRGAPTGAPTGRELREIKPNFSSTHSTYKKANPVLGTKKSSNTRSRLEAARSLARAVPAGEGGGGGGRVNFRVPHKKKGGSPSCKWSHHMLFAFSGPFGWIPQTFPATPLSGSYPYRMSQDKKGIRKRRSTEPEWRQGQNKMKKRQRRARGLSLASPLPFCLSHKRGLQIEESDGFAFRQP